MDIWSHRSEVTKSEVTRDGPSFACGRSTFSIHSIAFVAAAPENAKLLADAWAGTGAEHKELSHLCDNAGCINPKHLFLEDHATNMERSHCQRGLCEIGGEFFTNCTLVPPCIFPKGSKKKGRKLENVAEEFAAGD